VTINAWPARDAARAIDALKRGWPVAIDAADGGRLIVLAIETATDATLADFDGDRPADVLLSAARAATLHLANQREAASPTCPALIERVPWLDLSVAIALADPVRDLATPLKGPFRARAIASQDAAIGALRLARLAGLLPALFVRADGDAEASVGAAALDAYEDPSHLVIASRARLPVAATDRAEIVAFRHIADAAEHVALIIGTPDGNPPLVRLHSECLTGDVLGSLKCDCGPQLAGALHAMTEANWGILLYLRQEGRGIGLINKLRAYALQDQGFDTVDANLRLGFAIDARDFRVAARMLALLGQSQIRLMTNNPNKVDGLAGAGIIVTERVPHRMGANPHNLAYLETKRDRTGHKL
jgi:GTP cyclohydrolase II